MKAFYQQGMTMLSTLVVVVLVASGLLLAIKIVPLYIDDFAIAKGLESLQKEDDLYNMSKKDIRSRFSRKMSADYTRALTTDEMVITKEKDKLLIDVNYESRVPVVYNLDIVAKFSHHIEKQK